MPLASSRLIIFEGPDGSGKTTLAKGVADAIGALYVHLGPFPQVRDDLARLYTEAMMPAVLGTSHVVMDRCWISEVPYGAAFRKGQNRIGFRARLLDRLALRCEATVVNCAPPWEQVAANWGNKPEYLSNEGELALVASYYSTVKFTDIPTVRFNPLSMTTEEGVKHILDETSVTCSISHLVAGQTAGNLMAPVTIVTETPPMRDGDALYQWPMGSFAPASSSIWLAKQLDLARISELDAFWVPMEACTTAIGHHQFPIVALGDRAALRLLDLGRKPDFVVEHPDAWRHGPQIGEYQLITILKEHARGTNA